MNKIQINRVEDLVSWYRNYTYNRGVHVMETPLSENEIIDSLDGIVKVTYFRLYRYSLVQPFEECLIQSLSHALNDERINLLMDSLILGSPASKITAINQILFRCLSVLGEKNNRFLLMKMYGCNDDFDDKNLVLLENSIQEQTKHFVVVILKKHNVKQINNMIFNMQKSDKLEKVHISYKHLERHSQQIDLIYNSLIASGIETSIDKHDLDVRDSIKEYEKEIGLSKQVIVLITPEYLKSIQCMFELKEIIKNGDITKRLTVIGELDGIQRNADGLRKIKDFWNEEKIRKAEQIKTEPGQIKVLANELSIINDIITELDDAWLYISEHLTGNLVDMTENNASRLVAIIKKALSEEFGSISIGSTSSLAKISPTSSAPSSSRVIHQGEKAFYIENHNGDIIIN